MIRTNLSNLYIEIVVNTVFLIRNGSSTTIISRYIYRCLLIFSDVGTYIYLVKIIYVYAPDQSRNEFPNGDCYDSYLSL